MLSKYDVIVVGGGHAGCEAAAAAANLGGKVLLITMDMAKFASMSCNPAVGGIAKGQIVREIDALGGYMGVVTDKSTIQFRMLNRSKGPAMWSPRAQCDRAIFSIEWRNILESITNLDFWQDSVVKLIVEEEQILGVRTQLGLDIFSKSVVLTNGTFLNGLMHVGFSQVVGGRASEPASVGLTQQLISLGFESSRMKTGTPARLDGRSIDFSKAEEQFGDEKPAKFSFSSETKPVEGQLSCYIVNTNIDVHNHLRTGLKYSPLFTGTIKGIGPRYCPSIEDKIVTFADKNSHLLFLEPEGKTTIEYYLNGFSSSLPIDIQLQAMRKISGFEKVKVFRPGYAIEHDFFMPTQLTTTLETKHIYGLYFAGQINGTTGYEEAAAQGLIAGINAMRKIAEKSPFVLSRDEAYIGVLIDDLITKGVDEPYRMFTSRAEFRILLRQDNADLRLTQKGFDVGLVKPERLNEMQKRKNQIGEVVNFFAGFSVLPKYMNELFVKLGTSPLKQKTKLINIVARPQVAISDLIPVIPQLKELLKIIGDNVDSVIQSAEVQMKYSGYIGRERLLAEKLNRLEHVVIPNNYDFEKLKSLSTEARHKLAKVQPTTIGQASRISGVSPSDVNVLLVALGR